MMSTFARRVCSHSRTTGTLRWLSTVAKNENNPLTFVILEGEPIMSSKVKVLDRLKKMGYTTHHFDHFLDRINTQRPPLDLLLNSIVDVEHIMQQQMKNVHKEDHIFLDKSPLTPLLYLRPDTPHSNALKKEMQRLMQQYAVRLFICKSDEFESQFRLGCNKFELVDRDEKMTEEEYIGKYRSNFDGGMIISKEDEIVKFVHERYQQLEDEKWFEKTLITT